MNALVLLNCLQVVSFRARQNRPVALSVRRLQRVACPCHRHRLRLCCHAATLRLLALQPLIFRRIDTHSIESPLGTRSRTAARPHTSRRRRCTTDSREHTLAST